MHENGEKLPAVAAIDGHDSSGGCLKGSMDVSVQDSSGSNAADISQISQVHESFSENSKHFHEEFYNEESESNPIAGIEQSYFDSFELYKEVTVRGGFEKVTKDRRWGEVASVLNLKIKFLNPSFLLQQNYPYLLEQMYLLTMKRKLATSDDHRAHTGKIIAGPININFDSVSLMTSSQVGPERLNSFLYHAEECADDQFAIVPGLMCASDQDSDPEPHLQTCCTPIKHKSRSGSKKVATKKDRHAPLGARNAYQIFVREQLGQLKKVRHQNTRKMVTNAWKSLSETERLPYVEMSRSETNRISGSQQRKRKRSAYHIFLHEQCNRLKEIQQDKGLTNMKMVTDAWKRLSESERLPYIEESRRDKERYEREIAKYKEWQNTENRKVKHYPDYSKVSFDDCYHVSLEMESESGELFSDEFATQLANLDASQIDWDFLESFSHSHMKNQ